MASNYRASVILGDAPKALGELLTSGARPPVVKVHNNVSHVQLLHDCLGDDTIIILRMTATEGIVNRAKSATSCAIEWCEAMKPVFEQVPFARVEAGPPLQPCDDWYANFQIAAMNWAHARGYRLTVMTIGEGNPELPSSGHDGMAPMWPVVQLAASYGYILGPQAYWIDGNMSPDDDWHMFRIYRAFRDYPGMWPEGTQIVFSECGIDLRNGLGWRTALGTNWPRYRAGLKVLSEEIKRRPCPPGVRVIGGTVFATHDVDDVWPDFNYREYVHEQYADMLAEQGGIVEIPPTPVPDPVPAGTVPVLVTNAAGVNQRSGATSSSTKLGWIGPGAHLLVEYPATNDYVKASGQDFWVWTNNIVKEK